MKTGVGSFQKCMRFRPVTRQSELIVHVLLGSIPGNVEREVPLSVMILRGQVADDCDRILACYIIDGCFLLRAFQQFVHIASVHFHFPVLLQLEQLVITAHVRLVEDTVLGSYRWQVAFSGANQWGRVVGLCVEDVTSLVSMLNEFVGQLGTAVVGFQGQHALCLVAQLESRQGTDVLEMLIADTASQFHLPHRTQLLVLLQFQVHGSTFGKLCFFQCPDRLMVFQHLDACHGIYGYAGCG